MIISHGRKYIFVHIPKTGGSSLSLLLEDKAKKDDVLIGDTPKAQKRRNRIKGIQSSGRLWKHSRISDIYGLVSQEQIEKYFVFTIVRNPWDRLVSYYHWLLEQNFDHTAIRIAKENSFLGFLKNPEIQQSLKNDAAYNYICDRDGLDRCDLYLRLEDISENLNCLAKRLDLKLPNLPHTNKSSRDKNYKEYYNAESKRIIGVLYADDIRNFGYEF